MCLLWMICEISTTPREKTIIAHETRPWLFPFNDWFQVCDFSPNRSLERLALISTQSNKFVFLLVEKIRVNEHFLFFFVCIQTKHIIYNLKLMRMKLAHQKQCAVKRIVDLTISLRWFSHSEMKFNDRIRLNAFRMVTLA